MFGDQLETSRSEQSFVWLGLQLLPEHARVLLTRRRIAELIRHLETLDASLAATMNDFHGRAPPDNPRDHAAHMNRLQVETEPTVAEVDRFWSAIPDHSEREESAARMAFLGSLDHAQTWRTDFIAMRAFARLELGQLLNEEERLAFQERDKPDYRDRLRADWADRGASLQQIASIADPPLELVAQKARVAFEAQHPGRAKELTQDHWMEAVRAWSRRDGAPKKDTAATRKWTALVGLLEKAGFKVIGENALRNAWLEWRKTCLSKAGIFTIQR